MWITPKLQIKHLHDNAGLPRPDITSAQRNKQYGIRHISSNNNESTKYATRLILALEDSILRERLPTMIDRYFQQRTDLPSDLRKIQSNLSSTQDIDKLLHYLNWNPRALSIIHSIFRPREYDIPEDHHEYSWAEVADTPVDTSNRPYILVTEQNTTTIVYFTQRPANRRESKNTPRVQQLDKRTEHNLASVKKFHQSDSFKLSTFHLDAAKASTTTDLEYLSTVHNDVNQIRQSYEKKHTKHPTNPKKPDLKSLQQTLEEIMQLRSHLDRTLLSRQRYIKMRRYIGAVRTRIQRLIEKAKEKNNQQPRITQFFPVQTHFTTINDLEPDPSVDQFEDYRGESD